MTWQPGFFAAYCGRHGISDFPLAPPALGRLSGPSQGRHGARGASRIHRLGAFAIHAKVAIFLIVEDLL